MPLKTTISKGLWCNFEFEGEKRRSTEAQGSVEKNRKNRMFGMPWNIPVNQHNGISKR
jgi:hypothetical protein